MLRILSISVLACTALWLLPGTWSQPPSQAPAASLPDGLAQGLQPLSRVEVKSMPPVDVQSLLVEDRQRAAEGNPLLRFAYSFAVDYTPLSTGTWEETGDQLVWRLRIVSPGARSLNLGFSSYFMPVDGKLYVYDAGYRTVIGPFTNDDNETHRQLWTPVIPGDELVVELQIPAAQLRDLSLELSSVNHGYTDFGTPSWLLSGSCNLDVVCSAVDGYPQVDPWRAQIRSVAVYQRSGAWACTGVMVNNTAQDLTPYFLTAYHCGVDVSTAPTMVVYWNYENSWCRPPGSVASGQPGDGSLAEYQTGALFRAGYERSDFTLVELDDDPDEEWNVYWAGWDRSNADPLQAITVHHPNTQEKRISFENDPTTTTSYLQTLVPGDGTHIRIADWDLGTTEPGSSGSPLFNQDQRLVGQLHGGNAACYNDESDWYGRFSVSWTGGGTPSTRLRDWLDPLDTGFPLLDGRGWNSTPFALHITPTTLDVCAPDEAIVNVAVEQRTAGFADPVTLSANGQPTGTTLGFGTNPVVPPGASTMTIGDTAHALAGSYYVDVKGTTASASADTKLTLNLYTGVAAQPMLTLPVDGAEGQISLPTFSWSGVPLATSYNLELDRDPLFGSPLIVASGLLDPMYTTVDPLGQGSCYWWRVQSSNACGPGDWAGPFHFATARLATNFADAIEAGTGKWTHAAAEGQDHWQISQTHSHSPSHAWYVPDDATVTDSYLWMTVPVFVSAGSVLTFWHRYDFEDKFDGAVIEISTNGGSWTDLGAYIEAPYGYNGHIDLNYGNPLAGQQAWTGELYDWTQIRVDLRSFGSQTIQVRWRLGTDWSVGDSGWYIDDVEIHTPLPAGPTPVVLAVVPDTGSPGVDTPVRIVGSNFVDTPSLKLGDTWLSPVVQVSPTLLKATIPAGIALGGYDLALYNGDCQQASLHNVYTVTAECIAPLPFLESDSPAAPGEALHFEAGLLAGTLPLTYTWDFGGQGYGAGFASATPVFTYTYGGQYTATVQVQNLCGIARTTQRVTVGGIPRSVYLPIVTKATMP